MFIHKGEENAFSYSLRKTDEEEEKNFGYTTICSTAGVENGGGVMAVLE